jgi:hypothetical protein
MLRSWFAVLVMAGAAVLPLRAAAQSPGPSFPDDAVAPTAAELQQRLAGKGFTVKRPAGVGWNVAYKADGHFSMTGERGFTADGDWNAQDGKLCTNSPKLGGASCNEVRVKGGALYFKRDSGEVVEFVGQ